MNKERIGIIKVYGVALSVFLVVDQNGLQDSLFRVAAFGILTYETYDLTNLALIEGWPVLVTAVHIIWGMILSLIVCLVSLKVGRHFD